jgi:hypothetical protein
LRKKKKKLQVKPVVALADAVADASAKEVLMMKWEVVVVDVDASRVNPAVVLESTLVDTAGEFLVDYGR